MRWVAATALATAGVAYVAGRTRRAEIARFRQDVRDGMAVREAQLREVLALDTHLTLPGERTDDARAIEGR